MDRFPLGKYFKFKKWS